MKHINKVIDDSLGYKVTAKKLVSKLIAMGFQIKNT
jgi:hypothetical protein